MLFRSADLRRDQIDTAVADCKAGGGNAYGLIVDVTQRTSVDAMVAAVKQQSGRVDILVNNAGITKDARLVKTMAPSLINRLAVARPMPLAPPVMMATLFLRRMIARFLEWAGTGDFSRRARPGYGPIFRCRPTLDDWPMPLQECRQRPAPRAGRLQNR